MTTAIDMREAVKRAYNSRAWTLKVDRMADEQVIAIYKRLKQQNKV